MTEEDKHLSEQESLQLIASMLQKAKGGYHETGTSAILWGSVVTLSGLVSFAELFWNFDIGFDIWLLTLLAIVPQIIISVRESRARKVVTRDESLMGAVWTVFGISVFAMSFYLNIMPFAAQRLISAEHSEWLIKNLDTGEIKHLQPHVLSLASPFLILYAIPTTITGIARKFRPMIVGGVLCYVFFIASCYSNMTYDMLLMGAAGLFNWFIPGLILRKNYLKTKAQHV